MKQENLSSVENQSPQMPTALPGLVSLLLKEVPEVTHCAVANAIFPSLAAHLCDVQIEELDRRFRTPIILCALLAKQSSGKDAVNKPISRIMADIDAEDAVNRDREQAYRDLCKRCDSRRAKPEEPADLIIRHLSANMTNAAFIRRLRHANGATTYTSMDELDTLRQLQGAGVDPMKICCLAYDAALYGQERVGSNSESAFLKLKWCWNASSTIARGKRFFANGVLDGTVSRINFCTIEKERCVIRPKYEFHEADEESYMAELKPYIDNLNRAKGRYSCPEALAMAERMADLCNERMVLTENDIYDDYAARAISIALRKAMVLYIADGCRWSREIEDFCLWSLDYDLWCKDLFFNEMLRKAEDGEEIVGMGRNENMLDSLDEKFTLKQASDMRVSKGLSLKGVYSMINNWVTRGFIVRISNGVYCKTSKCSK